MAEAPGKPLVAVRAYFPDTLDAAVRQKRRWMTGIALAGWDRLRWNGGLAERWMRLRDRRAVIAALVLAVSYLGMALGLLTSALGVDVVYPAWAMPILSTCATLLVWRLLIRAVVVGRVYGWREGVRAIPRVFVANAIAIRAGISALCNYVPGAMPVWDKTTHHFPDAAACD